MKVSCIIFCAFFVPGYTLHLDTKVEFESLPPSDQTKHKENETTSENNMEGPQTNASDHFDGDRDYVLKESASDTTDNVTDSPYVPGDVEVDGNRRTSDSDLAHPQRWTLSSPQRSFDMREDMRGRRYIGDGHIGTRNTTSTGQTTTTLYHCHQLAILRRTSQHGRTYSCTISERLTSEEDVRRQMEEWRNQVDVEVALHQVEEFLDVVEDCMSLGAVNVDMGREVPLSAQEVLTAIWEFIAPGTVWCGYGQKADSLSHLGRHWKVDQCCRIHDLCPFQLNSLVPYKGLVNAGLKPLSHCACDERFFRCLKSVQSEFSRVVFHFYFNILFRRGQCAGTGSCLDDGELMKPADWLTVWAQG